MAHQPNQSKNKIKIKKFEKFNFQFVKLTFLWVELEPYFL